MIKRSSVPAGAAGLLAAALAASCGTSPAAQDPSLPGFDGGESEQSSGAAVRRGGEEDAAGTDGGGPAQPPAWSPPDEEGAITGRAIFEADRHLRAWTAAMAQPRDAANQEKVTFTAMALGRVVKKHQAVLERQAVSGAPRNRGIASAALGFSGDPRVLPLLTNNAVDPDPGIASKALLGLGVLVAEDTPTGPIHTAVTAPTADETVMRNAAFALMELAERWRRDPDGGLASTGMVLLDYPDASVRWQAALALGYGRCNVALPPLTDLLAADPSPRVRATAAVALGHIGARGSTGPLIQALKDPDELTAGAARAALTRIHGRDLGAEPHSWDPVRER